MKFVISNIYSPKNLGDRAILEAVISVVQKVDQDCQIEYMSKYSKELSDYFGDKVFPNVINVKDDQPIIIQLIATCFDIFRFFSFYICYKIFGKSFIRILSVTSPFRRLVESDYVLPVGGNYLFSSNQMVSRNFFLHLINMYAAKLVNNKVILFPQSYGPVTRKYERKVLKYILNKTDVVCCRDLESKEFLQQLGVKDAKLRLIPDIAFVHPSIVEFNEKQHPIAGKKIKILFTVLDWTWSIPIGSSAEREELLAQYLDAVKATILHLINNYDCEICLFSQVTSLDTNDYLISKKLADEINDEQVYVKNISDKSLDLVYDYYKGFDMVIGSRMHSCIFGISLNKPTIAIAYQPKSIGLFNLLNLGEHAIDASVVDADSLIQCAKRIIDNYDEFIEVYFETSGSTKSSIIDGIYDTLNENSTSIQ